MDEEQRQFIADLASLAERGRQLGLYVADLPWKRPELADWRIVGMNHYRQDGADRLYIAMTRGDRAVQAEGPDAPALWNELAAKAAKVRVRRDLTARLVGG